MFVPDPSHGSTAAAPAAVGAPSVVGRVRDADGLELAWRAWREKRGLDPDPDTRSASIAIWWDTPDGRLYRRGAQLLQRTGPDGGTRLRLQGSRGERDLPAERIQHWLLRGRPLTALLGLEVRRRVWTTQGGGGLEWTQWRSPHGPTHHAVAARGDHDGPAGWLRAPEVRRMLAPGPTGPTWPDHAHALVLHHLLAPAGAPPGAARKAARLRVAAALHAAWLAEDSPLAGALAERLGSWLHDFGSRPRVPDTGRHPLWRHALATALRGRARLRTRLLDALAEAVLRGAPPAGSARVEFLALALGTAAPWIDAGSRKTVRRLRRHARRLRHREELGCTDAILAELVGAADLDAESALEIGARRRRIGREIAALDADIARRGRPRIGRGLQRWARERRAPAPPHGG